MIREKSGDFWGGLRGLTCEKWIAELCKDDMRMRFGGHDDLRRYLV